MKRVPTSKKGYFSKFVIKISPTNPKPNLAPAVVDNNRCEPPIAAPASKIPGPKLFCIACLKNTLVFFFMRIYFLLTNYLHLNQSIQFL